MASKAQLTVQEVSSKLIQHAQDFAPRIKELSGAMERARSLDSDLVREMAKAGFFTHNRLSGESNQQAY